MKIIKNNPKKYESIKAFVRKKMPISKNNIRRVTSPIRAIHQRYFEDFVFIHINKCGGTSMERALGMPFINHRTAEEHRNIIGNKLWSMRYKFALVRNPYDRLGSLFFYRHKDYNLVQARRVFPSWLDEIAEKNINKTAGPKLSPQLSWISDSTGSIIIDQWLKLETINEEIGMLEIKLNQKLNLNVLNKRKDHINYMDLYDDYTKSVIQDIFFEDFDTFNY